MASCQEGVFAEQIIARNHSLEPNGFAGVFLHILREIAVKDGKTKEMVAFKEAFKFEKTVLVVMDNADEKVIRAARNIEKLETLPVEQINTYDVVKNAVIVLSKGSVEKLQEVYGE